MCKIRTFSLIFILMGILYGKAPIVIDSVILSKPVLRGDPFFIWDAKIEDDSVSLNISYIGGKQDHVFKLFAFNRKIEENKFYMDLILSHRAKADTQQSIISTTLRFDLSPLKRKYRFSNNTLYLNLFKLSELKTVQMLTYNL
jgi:hypothetical protein